MERGLWRDSTEAESTTLADALARYEGEITNTKRGAVKEKSILRTLSTSSLAACSMASIRGVDIAKLRDAWLGEGLAPATVTRRLAVLSHVFNVAVKEWGMESLANPVQRISKPAVKNDRDRRLERKEEIRLLAECEPHMAALIRFAIETAARLGELLSVKWADIDLARRVMIVRGIDERGTKNGDALRQVPLSSAAVEVLEGLRAMPRSIDGRVFWWWKASDSFNKTWRRVCTRAGVDGLRFHDLRHEATSRLFERGVFDTMEVASITGHKTLQMLKRYTHLRAEDLAKKLG